MKLKYLGVKKDLVLKITGLSKPCDFSKGSCEVTKADGELLLTTCPRSFEDVTPAPKKVEDKKAK